MFDDEDNGFSPATPLRTVAAGGLAADVRRLSKDGRLVLELRRERRDGREVVECTVHPPDAAAFPRRLGPWAFSTLSAATGFCDDLVVALEYLGCRLDDAPPARPLATAS